MGHRLHRRIGEQRVGEVPAVRIRKDRGVGEAAILLADRVEIGIVQRLARPMPLGKRGRDLGASRGMIGVRSEEHTSELQSLMRSSYAVFCLKNKTTVKHQQL